MINRAHGYIQPDASIHHRRGRRVGLGLCFLFRGGGSRGKSRPRRKKGSPRAGATIRGSTNDTIGTMAGDDEQRQPLLGNESQGDYGASTSGGAPPDVEAP